MLLPYQWPFGQGKTQLHQNNCHISLVEHGQHLLLHPSDSETLEKVADLSAIIKATITVSFKSLYDCVLLFVNGNTFFPIPPLLHTIIVGVLWLLFFIGGLPSNMAIGEILLVDAKVNCSTIQTAFSLLYIDICIFVGESDTLLHYKSWMYCSGSKIF